MLSQGVVSPIDQARAALQEKIGDFLAARARLIRLMNNPSLTIQGQAKGLYAVQLQLEDQLAKEIYPKIQSVQAGSWSFGDIAILGTYTSNIIAQINSVGSLERSAGIVPGTGSSVIFAGMDTQSMAIIGLISLGVLAAVLYGRS
jgi:hypothetical protein